MPVRMDRKLGLGRVAMAGRQRGLSCLLLLLPLGFATTLATAPPSPTQPQSQALQGLANTRWEIRSRAVAQLATIPPDSIGPDARRALINLLQSETAALWNKLEGTDPEAYPPQGEAGEPWAEYYASILGTVAKLHDPSAVPALVDAAAEPDPRLDKEIASQGASAIAEVRRRLDSLSSIDIRLPGFTGVEYEAEQALMDILAQLVALNRTKKLAQPLSRPDLAAIQQSARPFLRSKSPWVATRAARTLAVVAAPSDEEAVRETFAGLLKDPDHNRREIALSAMRGITDSRFVPVNELKRVAERDSFQLAGPTADYPVGAHPLRHQAAQILRNLHPAQ